jgi:hypothetical protein
MAGMSLIGAGAMLDGFGEMADTFSGSSNGYRMGTNVEYAVSCMPPRFARAG